jgi:hypothetical protein
MGGYKRNISDFIEMDGISYYFTATQFKMRNGDIRKIEMYLSVEEYNKFQKFLSANG